MNRMNSRAYIGAYINVETGEIQYGTYSEWPLTRYMPNDKNPVVHALIAEARGESYSHALHNLSKDHCDGAFLIKSGVISVPQTRKMGVSEKVPPQHGELHGHMRTVFSGTLQEFIDQRGDQGTSEDAVRLWADLQGYKFEIFYSD